MRKKHNFFRAFIVLLIGVFLSPINVLAVDQKVYDQAELFTVTQGETLQQQAATLSGELELDIVIVTTNENDSATSQAYADDFYDNNGFGYGQDEDGVLLLINMQDREINISTRGIGMQYLTAARIESVLDKIYPYISSESYSEGADTFLSELQNYIYKAIPSNQVTADESGTPSVQTKSDVSNQNGDALIKRMLISLLGAVIIGAGVVGIMAANNRGKIDTNEGTYLDEKSFKLLHSVDRHVNTTVTHVTINTDSRGSGNSGSSGKSSTHTSSSGKTHGGGGRKF